MTKTAPCVVEDLGNGQWWCLDCKRYHAGHTLEYALSDTDKGDSYRRLWRGMPQVDERKPILRSLQLVKQCIYLGNRLTLDEIKEKQLVGCRSCNNEIPAFHCKLPGAKKFNDGPYTRHGECMGCGDWKRKHTANAVNPPHVRFDHNNLAPNIPGMRFNPSIIESPVHDGYIFAFRNGWAGSNIYLICLDKQFKPRGETKELPLLRNGCHYGREDPRLFRLNGKLHIMYIGVIGIRGPTNVLFARINEETFAVEDNFFPWFPGRQSWEKNWAMFDYQGIAHAVYSITPHRILKIEGNKAEEAYSTETRFPWSGGELRGGAAPVLHNDMWYHFFHGKSAPYGKAHYNLGLVCFSAEPPFDIIRYTPSPIDEAEHLNTINTDVDCIFPCGAVFVNGQWAISMGVHDRWSEIRFYDGALIESLLENVK